MVKTANIQCRAVICALAMMSCCMLSAAESATRTIRLRQDDAQVRFESKVYELKNASAEEILPFVSSAILRYDRNSTMIQKILQYEARAYETF